MNTRTRQPRAGFELACARAVSETDRVPKRCSCGAELPPDALFCHKCGKPQVELPEVEPPPPAPAVIVREPEPVPPAAPPEVNFRNRAVVRVALVAAILSTLLTSLPLPFGLNFLMVVVAPVAAGFFAVYLYTRRTGAEPTLKLGARVGWITGIFSFAITTVMFAITIVMISTTRGGVAAFYREQISKQAAPGVDIEAFFKILETPAGVASILFFSLLLIFAFYALLPTLGGILGAKILEKE